MPFAICNKLTEVFFNYLRIKMYKILIITTSIIGLVILPQIALAQNDVDVWVFGTATCPYCKELKEHINNKLKDDPHIKFSYFELTGITNQDNRDNLDKLKEIYNATNYSGIPITFIGDSVIRGARLEEVDAAIKDCEENGCESPAEKLANYVETDNPNNNTEPVGQTEQAVGWVILTIFILVVAIFGVKIIKERKSL
ncbi:hypothetical protein KKA15_06485 [Patescibacteria group bacterium]|nr:hypothetical protein [Patescibacteria group bacterium]